MLKKLYTLLRSTRKSYDKQMLRLLAWSKVWRDISSVFVVALIFILAFGVYTFWTENGTFSSLLFSANRKNPTGITPLFNIKDLLIGVSGLIAIFATAWRYKLHEIENLLKTKDAEIKERDSNINDVKRLDDQFAKAVELLKEDNDLTVRRGGVYILKNLALKSPQHLQQCVDLLCSLNNWMSGALQRDPEFFTAYDEQNRRWNGKYLEDEPWRTHLSNPPTELEKELRNEEKRFRNKQIISRDVLKIIAELLKSYSLRHHELSQKLSLLQYNLCGISLQNISNTSFIDWRYVNLHTAHFYEVNFDRAEMYSANISYAGMGYCSAKETDFNSVNFEGSDFWSVDLRCSSMRNTKALGMDMVDCQLQGVDMSDGDFRICLFKGVQMQGTYLKSIELSPTRIIFTDANFDGSVFYESCLTGSTFVGLRKQAVVYEAIDDKWEKLSEADIIGSFQWKNDSSNALKEAYKSYLEYKASNSILCSDGFFKINANLKQIGKQWAEETEEKPTLRKQIERRFTSTDDDFQVEVLYEINHAYEEEVTNK